MFQGVCYAFSREDLPQEYFDAIAQSPEEAEDLELWTNYERSKSRARDAKGPMAQD